MSKQTLVQNNFTSGEISPRAYAQYNLDKYPNSVKKVENFLLNQLGGAQFFPGTRFVDSTKDPTAKTRLIPFQFNSAQAYIIEAGDKYMRFYTQGAKVIQEDMPIDSNTKLLLHFDGSDNSTSFVDSSASAHTIVANGTSKLRTVTKKFGTSSLNTSGAITSYASTVDSADYHFGTGDFTIDFWVNFATIPSFSKIFELGNYTGNGIGFQYVQGTRKISTFINNTEVTNTTYTFVAGVFYHIAIVRSSGVLHLFVNGVEVHTVANTQNFTTTTGGLRIGAWTNNTNGALNGFVDEFRISNVARWTSNFTPPTASYGQPDLWATGTAYNVNDIVSESGVIYRCLIAHTSGTFATDLAAGDWIADDSLEIVTPYSVEDVPNIHFSQNADVMYLYHSSYPTQKLTRVSAMLFTIADAPFIRGPFLDTNITGTTITPSSATGATNLVASAAIFQSGHVGSLWRIKNAVVKITTFTDSTHVAASVQSEPNGTAGNIGTTSATTDWSEGAFSDVRGYPSTGTFHQQRQYVAATTFQPQKIWGTYIGAFDNFKTDANDPSAAVSFELVSEQVNSIQWLNSDSNFLVAGTSAGTFTISSGTQGIAITATNINSAKDSSYGANKRQPRRLSSFLYYIHKTTFKLFELVFSFLINREISGDMTELADHILRDGNGAYSMDYQQTPNDRIWVLRNDGQIALLNRNNEQQIKGWTRRISAFDSMSMGIFESIAIIQQDNTDDQIWVIVKRTINGSTVRYVEYFTSEYFTYEWEPVLLDSSLTLDNPLFISGINALILLNGSFDIWPTANQAPTGWTLASTGAASVARESSIVHGGLFSAKLTRTGFDCILFQNIQAVKGIEYWKGRSVTYTCWVYATVATRARLAIFDGIGISFSSYHTGSGAWEQLTVTRTIDLNATIVEVYGSVINGDTSAYFDEAVLIDNAASDHVVITSLGHGLSNGDQIKIDKVVGSVELNGNSYIVADATADDFSIKDLSSNYIMAEDISAYISGGEVRKKVQAISGLNHLEGETVSVQGDGQVPTVPTYLVSGGSITLSEKYAVVHVGLSYTGKIQMLRLSGQTRQGTGQTKKHKPYRVDFRVFQSKRFKIAQSENDSFKTVAMPVSAGTGLFTGDINNFRFGNYWSEDVEMVIEQDQPLPLFLEAVFTRNDIEELE